MRLYLFPLMIFILLAGVSASAASVSAGKPTDQLKETVDGVIEILKDRELKKPGNTTTRRKALRKVVGKRFNYEEMGRRSLARHWRKRTAAEKEEFVRLYSDLLEQRYINKIEQYTDETVLYDKEKVDDDYAVVKTRVVTGADVKIPIDYRLSFENNNWMVYDVVVEGVSLVKNYRTQFNRILRKNSFSKLIEKIKKKLEK